MNLPELNLADIKATLKSEPEKELPEGILKLPKETITVKLSEDGVQVKFEERSRGRMKFQIKFSNEEAQSFRNYCSVFKADEMHMDDFIKFLVFEGMTSYNAKVNEAVSEIQNDPEAMIEAGLEAAEVDQDQVSADMAAMEDHQDNNDSTDSKEK